MPKSHTAAAVLERALDQDWIEDVADVAQPLIRNAEALLPEAVQKLLHGDLLGHPAHAALVHLPLGGWVAASVLDVMGLFGREGADEAADRVLTIGTVGAVATIATGWSDWARDARGAARRDGLAHGAVTESAFWLNVGSIWARRKGHRQLGRLLTGSAAVIAVVGGFMGGQLVFVHGLGTRKHAGG